MLRKLLSKKFDLRFLNVSEGMCKKLNLYLQMSDFRFFYP